MCEWHIHVQVRRQPWVSSQVPSTFLFEIGCLTKLEFDCSVFFFPLYPLDHSFQKKNQSIEKISKLVTVPEEVPSSQIITPRQVVPQFSEPGMHKVTVTYLDKVYALPR